MLWGAVRADKPADPQSELRCVVPFTTYCGKQMSKMSTYPEKFRHVPSRKKGGAFHGRNVLAILYVQVCFNTLEKSSPTRPCVFFNLVLRKRLSSYLGREPITALLNLWVRYLLGVE